MRIWKPVLMAKAKTCKLNNSQMILVDSRTLNQMHQQHRLKRKIKLRDKTHLKVAQIQ